MCHECSVQHSDSHLVYCFVQACWAEQQLYSCALENPSNLPVHFHKIPSSAVPSASTQAYPVPCLPGAIDPRPVDFDLIIQQARERIRKTCRNRQLLGGQASIDGCFENPCWPGPAPKGWVPPFWRNEREEDDWSFADEYVQEVREGRRKAAESLERHLKARREEQLDKWLEKTEEEVEEIDDGSQRILERATEVGGGQ